MRRVVLYNPAADFSTMPLALIALGSALDRRRYDVRIVDGRLEDDPVARVLQEADGAVCLGVTALTGSPLRDALRVTRAVRASRPELPIVWGGWHPSLFPTETLLEAGVDATVQGQGEVTFAEIVDRLEAGTTIDDVPGCTVRRPDGSVSVGPPRSVADLNGFARHDYGLALVEQYFLKKQQRQLDYVSSQGCRFRCAFCADPTVFGRAWFGLDPARVGEELAYLERRYRMTDVAFQDETFFTHGARVASIAEELIRRNAAFTWMATMRADQGSRLDTDLFDLCRRAGLRRVMIGLESGSQAMLDWMKKDATVEQAFHTAAKCRQAGIAALFNLIVGFPGESDASVRETMDVAKRLRAMGPQFQVAIFYYKPYPGTAITSRLVQDGYQLPTALEAWAGIDDDARPSPWVDASKRTLIERFKFYQRIAWAPRSALRAPLQAVARWRCQHDFYQWPVEQRILNAVRTFAPQG